MSDIPRLIMIHFIISAQDKISETQRGCFKSDIAMMITGSGEVSKIITNHSFASLTRVFG